jgi:hypothetical protein
MEKGRGQYCVRLREGSISTTEERESNVLARTCRLCRCAIKGILQCKTRTPLSSYFPTHRPTMGRYLYNSSYSLPTHPTILPSLPTTPKPPANHSAVRAALIPLIAYHLRFRTNALFSSVFLTWLGAKPSHLAAPQTKCHTPTPTSAVKPVKETAGCSAKPWEMYCRLMREESPCA